MTSNERPDAHLSRTAVDHSLLAALGDLAEKLTGVRLVVVFPSEEGWSQVRPGADGRLPDFCRLIQSCADGAKQCKMCHILMSVAACSEGVVEHRCHAGLSVLAVPIARGEDEALAVLSTCTFARGLRATAWQESRKRGTKLGVDLRKLKSAYENLPELPPDKMETACALMRAAAEAVKVIRSRFDAERALQEMKRESGSRMSAQAAVDRELKNAMQLRGAGKQTPRSGRRRTRRMPVLVELVADLVSRKPAMPFTVDQIATAARITPNHFSMIFRKHTGQCFSDFLTERRMALAKELLADITMNIREAALKTGFDDPGYFARRFRQETGMSPREWRQSNVRRDRRRRR